MDVSVYAPAGSLPAGSEMIVTPVYDEATLAKITAQYPGQVIAAVDISFRSNGKEIEPAVDVEVLLNKADLENTDNLTVIHMDDAGRTQEVQGVEITSSPKSVSFKSSDFSVYAIIDPQPPVDNARLTVNFWADTGKTNNRATVYVKNSDTLEELQEIVYDPGVGTLDSGRMFLGWTSDPNYTAETKPLKISDIRTELEAVTIEGNNMVRDYYAMIFQLYNVSFKDEYEATIKTDIIYFRADGETPDYKIELDYVPVDPNKKFNGWHVQSGTVTPEQDNYPVNTTITVASDVVFSVNAPDGAWLSFNENGRGASYTPPQFVPSGSTTTEPDDPTRRGYTFGGWYTGAPATEGGDPTGDKFTFGNELKKRQDLYAKWVPVETAPYTVIVWKQRASDDKDTADADKTYSVWEVITGLTGTVGSTITTVSQNGANVNSGRGYSSRNVSVNGQPYAATGFHCSRYDQNVTIAPEGNTVLNVYYDRNLITITFDAGTYYSWGTRYYYIKDGNSLVNTVTYTGLYDAPLTFSWPTKYYYSNGTEAGNAMWRYGNTTLSFIGSFKLPNPSNVSISFTRVSAGDWPVRFYQQDDSGEWETTAKDSVLFDNGITPFTITDKYAGFTAYEYRINTTSKTATTGWGSWTTVGTKDDEGNYVTVEGNNVYQLEIRFKRDKYPITYLDGTYMDGNGVTLKAATTEQLHATDPIFYDADVSTYESYEPNPVDGYTFSGWYLDSTCTHPATFDKMPEGGITVYAKWVQTQYRVFLHPNVPETDKLEWGQTNQQMNFRVTAGEKISGGNVINGDRAGRTYELVGWFTDPSLSNASYFNFDTVLNDTTVPATPAYVKTGENADFTDNMNKYGRITDGFTNSDVNRPWITRKLDLYAKWREILPGAKGINVVYDPNGGTGQPSDTQDYLDTSESIAQAASQPSDNTMQFKGWVLQTWDQDAEQYVDKTGDILNPGDTFTVLKSDAKQAPRLDDEGNQMVDENNEPLFTYTVVLKAVYDKFEAPTPTHINWYKNDGTGADPIYTDTNLKINEAVTIHEIPTRPGYEFLGWAKKNEYEDDDAENKQAITDYENLGEADLFLKWFPASGEGESAVAAHYAVKVGDNWVEVSKIAADERSPYDALYAVWQKNYFFVLHSSDGTLEAVEMPSASAAQTDAVATYDLSALVKDGFRYGGYYTNYGGVDSTVMTTVTSSFEKPTVNWTAATTVQNGVFSSLKMEDVDGSKFDPYSGNDLKADKTQARFWARANAGPETNPGNALKPTVGEVYYLKEVNDAYLTSKAMYVFDMTKNGEIQKIFLVTAYDDSYYKAKTIQVDSGTPSAVKFAATFSIISDTNKSQKTVTPKDFVPGANTAGFVGVLELEDKIEADMTIQMTPGWTTLDGVYVPGKARTYTINSTKTGFVE